MKFIIYLIVTINYPMSGYGAASVTTSEAYFASRTDCNDAVKVMAAELSTRRKHGIDVSGYCLPVNSVKE